jgi:hypothetical protein
MLPPSPLADPDVQISRIRFVGPLIQRVSRQFLISQIPLQRREGHKDSC